MNACMLLVVFQSHKVTVLLSQQAVQSGTWQTVCPPMRRVPSKVAVKQTLHYMLLSASQHGSAVLPHLTLCLLLCRGICVAYDAAGCSCTLYAS
jgi:hypothetical protein